MARKSKRQRDLLKAQRATLDAALALREVASGPSIPCSLRSFERVGLGSNGDKLRGQGAKIGTRTIRSLDRNKRFAGDGRLAASATPKIGATAPKAQRFAEPATADAATAAHWDALGYIQRRADEVLIRSRVTADRQLIAKKG